MVVEPRSRMSQVVTVLVIAAIVLVALFLLLPRDGQPGATATPTVSASAEPSVSASPEASESPSPEASPSPSPEASPSPSPEASPS